MEINQEERKKLVLKDKSDKTLGEVVEELAAIMLILSLPGPVTRILADTLAEFTHWLYAEPGTHSKASEILYEELQLARSSTNQEGKPLKYDA